VNSLDFIRGLAVAEKYILFIICDPEAACETARQQRSEQADGR
jgi:hypothetical protein